MRGAPRETRGRSADGRGSAQGEQKLLAAAPGLAGRLTHRPVRATRDAHGRVTVGCPRPSKTRDPGVPRGAAGSAHGHQRLFGREAR